MQRQLFVMFGETMVNFILINLNKIEFLICFINKCHLHLLNKEMSMLNAKMNNGDFDILFLEYYIVYIQLYTGF